MKKLAFLISLITFTFQSCTQSFGPGYEFELFKNTPNWELAKAVKSENEDAINSILKDKNININLQEPKFGRTLLMLAVGNDKELSTAALLKTGADVSLRDSSDDQVIHKAVNNIDLQKHSLAILKLLLLYHADANSISTKGIITVPLEGAIENFSCAKFLLDHGANPYIEVDSLFVVWFNLLLLDFPFNENIFVMKYMIIEKKMSIPDPIYFKVGQPISFLSLLHQYNVSYDPKKQQAKEEIINYLHQIDFPNHGIYKDTSTKSSL